MAATSSSLTAGIPRQGRPHTSPGTARQCEAARALIAEFLRFEALEDLSGLSASEAALKQLAAVHVDHPDFDLAWI
jgi:hypothetical protein